MFEITKFGGNAAGIVADGVKDGLEGSGSSGKGTTVALVMFFK